MADIKALHKKTMSYPTIMSINQEIELLNELIKIDKNTLLKNIDTTIKILNAIEESHAGGAIFESNKDNFSHLQYASNFLISLANLTQDPSKKSNILMVATTLTTKFKV